HILNSLASHQVYFFCHTPATGPDPSSFGLRFSGIDRELVEPDFSSLQAEFCTDHDIEARPWNQVQPLVGYARQLRSLFLAHQLQHDFANAHGIQFDFVFRLRFDNLYIFSLESLADLDSSVLRVPAHDSWGGVNDRFAFGSPAVMDVYCNRFRSLAFYINEGLLIHPETLLATHIARHGIKVQSTRVVHHLYRHGTLTKAIFHLDQGDDPSFCPPQPSMNLRFQVKKRFGSDIYDKLSLFWWKLGI
ncbi:MAG: hypothetical protein WCL28_14455, partial [bacterium]